MSTLVVYFSRSGHTRQVAQEVAKQCGADVEEIRAEMPNDGAWGYWRSGWQVLTHAEPPIWPLGKDPSAYNTVVIGTPIWIGQPAPAVRTFVKQQASRFNRVAFFCTEGGSGDLRAFDTLGRLCGKTPVATLTVTEKQLSAPMHASALNQFADQIAA
jgi:flavodoxin